MHSLHAASALVTWCEWARSSLIHDYGIDGSLITVIPPGVNLDLWPRPMPRAAVRPIRILFVGGDFVRKGGEILLQATPGLGSDSELHLVTKDAIQPRPGLHVYHDVVPNSELLKSLYASADIFVLPTLADCFPLVIQEAMAAGLPVIATNVGAIGEAVRDGETGILIPPNDVASLHSALHTLLCDGERRKDMGARGRAVAESRFDSAVNARKIISILTVLADRRRPANGATREPS